MMSENETVFNSLKGNTQDAIDKMVDAILLLRSLGLEPTGFTMDADILTKLCPVAPAGKALEHYAEGWFFLEDLLDSYDFSIMGIPIEPDFGSRVIKARRKKENGCE